MRGRIRYLIALCLVAMFGLAPSPDAATGKPRLGYLQVRQWLLGTESPLSTWQAAQNTPQLIVDLRQSPPIEDPTLQRERAGEYARLAHEWTLEPGRPGALRAAQPVALPLSVWIGEHGVQARLPQPDGSVATLNRAFPSRWSLLPLLLAIAIVVLTRRVLPALVGGGLCGALAFVATATPGSTPSAWTIALDGSWHFVADALWQRSIGDGFYLRIAACVLLLSMTIAVITHNGGINGLAERLARIVRGPTSAQFATIASGTAVFFDAHASCLLVGTTMRPLTDRGRISREKLAWLVDATAAPIAGLAVLSTWVVHELSQCAVPLSTVTRPDGTPFTGQDAFSVLLDTLPFRFYSWFTLGLIVLVVLTQRDFGPMLTAERRARHLGQPLAAPSRSMAAVDERIATPAAVTQHRARNAIVPLAVLLLATIGIMLWHGITAAGQDPPADQSLCTWWRAVLAATRSDVALLSASAAALMVAIVMTLAQRLLSLRATLVSALRSARAPCAAIASLFLLASLRHIGSDLGTGLFLCASVHDAMTAAALPLLSFVVASAIAFATGTSFSTLAILLPNVVVLAHHLGAAAAFGGDAATGGTALMLLSIGAVLEGAIFGEHCSPLSDTTVLSSIGARCDLFAHVTTQLPYALLAMLTSACCGYLPVLWLGPHIWPVGMAAGLLVMAGTLRLLGRNASRPPANASPQQL